MDLHCGFADCALGEATVRSQGMAFHACPRCTALRIPKAELLHERVEADPARPTPRIMHLLFGLRMRWLARAVPELRDRDAAILDAGCGDGQFLAYLNRRGYRRTAGYEIQPERLAHARARGVSAHPTLAAAAAERGPRFDVVLLWHVYEHLTAPLPVVQELLRTLADDGVLLLSVPNQGSLQTRLFGRRSAFIDYHRHLWYLGEPYFAWLEGALPGYRVRRIPERNLEYEFYGWVDSLASNLLGRVHYVHLALKKGEGGPWMRRSALALALLVSPLAALATALALALPSLSSTLTYAVRREPSTGGGPR